MSERIENKELCSKCKGVCCKRAGCHLSPDDVIKLKGSITRIGLYELLKTGNYSIDWWDGFEVKKDNFHGKGYYLRMRHVGANIIDPSWGGVCVLLTDNGCPLSYDNRPKSGRLLVPDKNYNCITPYSKYDSVCDWYKYWKILNELVKIF